MGTRALTFVYDSYKDEDGVVKYTPIINLYRQYDGYPSGHGAELAEFLGPFTMTNGLPVGRDKTDRKIANGMGCLAAQLVSHFKGSDAGQFYLYPTSSDNCGQDYEYHIYNNILTFLDDDGIEHQSTELSIRITNRGCNLFGLTMSDTNENIFDGPVLRFEEFCKEEA
jgi:hypothetical protein